ncbi:ATP-dependent DNA helicase [Marisediminicola sp. LYQ134]|uniref:ATP-dependent DNA helicase n=1 Tax=Marisediminicola sp. LYQ134 TaxID=3391061 RepID=UPI0039835ADA
MISALDIADALERPRPTPQQQAVIEADLAPALVVAGAGSGKTETMASRVLWLLANGLVSADQVLGLTFTRKAAGELGVRIRERITELASHGLVSGDYDSFDPPTVSTYNAFSNRIFRDNAMLLGRDSEGAVLGEASSWQLARRVVVASTDPRVPALERSVDQITKDVLSLSRAMTENVVDRGSLAEFADRFGSIVDLPAGGRGAYAEVDKLASRVGALPVLIDLAARYDDEKLRRGFVEYSDQVALALEIVDTVPAVVSDHRDRYRVVLLDEYQDTSVVQTWLLARLFAEHPVMAVGDPNQSIYGWRGASSANLGGFSQQFGGTAGARRFSLSTSWRNGSDILRVANAIVEPLATGGKVEVDELLPGPHASDAPVSVVFAGDILEEADAAARWLATRLRPLPGEQPRSAAMLFRARATRGVFIEALRRHGVPFHVLGVGGLLDEPEIADLVSALRVLHDPTAGSELVRLLAGSRWRVGPRDLLALRDVSRWLASRDYAQRRIADDVREALRDSVADVDGGSIVDAVDFVATAKPDHSVLEGFSPEGLERVRDAGRVFARLRSRGGLDLVDLVTIVEHELRLDIEVAANESRGAGRAPMDAFTDALDGYLAVDESASLGGFLSWLREAEWRDGLAPRPEEPEPGTVQLMTIHGSKGLERDIVVVPRLVDGDLPSKAVDGTSGWLAPGALPWPFRGDAADLPRFEWEAAESRKHLLENRSDFADAVRERHVAEERRLAYVAVTRARHHLLLTGSFWASQKLPRAASPFLTELAARGVIAPLPEFEEGSENPLGGDPGTFSWPLDPLGHRRPAVERAAARVRAAEPRAEGVWGADLALLLEERRRRLDPHAAIDIPVRVPASRFKDFVTEPETVTTALRRPMPERPYRATRLGTLFHSWVEQRYGVGGAVETLDALDVELDDDGDAVDADRLGELQRIFESSPWADRAPVDVEREIHLPFDGRIVVCKIDAVYAEGDRFQVVDWKTGKAPRDADDLEQKQMQLALYRLAYARWRGIDPERIDAVFYFVADDRIVRPDRLFSESELVARWRAALTPAAAPTAGIPSRGASGGDRSRPPEDRRDEGVDGLA